MSIFGGFDDDDLLSLEDDANNMGLTTTAFHYMSEDHGETLDFSYVNAHFPGNNPLEGDSELSAFSTDDLRWKMANWSQAQTLLGSADDLL